jgi:zinc protease
MIEFEKFTLENDLRVIVHQDPSTQIAAVNVLYDVGARDENPDLTGFAHLFEHLMFGGSVNIPNYDEHLQRVGGQNNAFTSNDITNYYITLPVNNIETAFWLESDRMLSLAFTDKSLEVQRNVVIEEFKQRYLNQPYGDVWLNLRPLAYKEHPYKWATIGKEISHVENANMQQVKDFFTKHYNPSNAILVVAGNITIDQIKILSNKWFGNIPKGKKYERNLPIEPKQFNENRLVLYRNVPSNSIYMAWHMPDRLSKKYYAVDLLSDILSGGKSSRFYNSLIKDQQLFTNIDAYITGSIDAGLFVISGNIRDGVTIQQAENSILNEIKKLKEIKIEENELQKVKNKVESTILFSELTALNKAMNLAYYELIGNANFINHQIESYQTVSINDLTEFINDSLIKENCSVLHYLKEEKND